MQLKHGTFPLWAEEALHDEQAIILDPDPASKSGKSIRTIGWSTSAGCLLTVITVVDEGIEFGVNCWKSSSRDKRIYGFPPQEG
ncbi:transposase [Corynebacterium uropygiale]|uniref:Transposase n=1 Tax=Corynebacterium uropygiale TaxID=1775911 RepID=A0A9X1U6G6_9CORY|nr:transposase [Corynebacterium uropygiale]